MQTNNNNNNNNYALSTTKRSRTLTNLQFLLGDNKCDVNLLNKLIDLYDVTKDNDDNVNNEIKTIINECIKHEKVKNNVELMNKIEKQKILSVYSTLNREMLRPSSAEYSTSNSVQKHKIQLEERKSARANKRYSSDPASSGPASSGYASASSPGSSGSSDSPYELAMSTRPSSNKGPVYEEVSPDNKPEYEEVSPGSSSSNNNSDYGYAPMGPGPGPFRPANTIPNPNSGYMEMAPQPNYNTVKPVDPFKPEPTGGARKNKSYKSKKANKAKKANNTNKASKVKKTKKAKMNIKSRARKNTKRNGNNVNTGRNGNNVNTGRNVNNVNTRRNVNNVNLTYM